MQLGTKDAGGGGGHPQEMPSAVSQMRDTENVTQNIQMLLSSLDKDVGGNRSPLNKSFALSLLNSVTDNQTTMQGDLSSLLESFKNGLISADHLDTMIQNEHVRSQFILSESINIQKHLETLFQTMKKIADRMPMHSDVNDDMEDVVMGMSSAMRSMGGFSKVVKTPAREINDVVTNLATTRAREEISKMTPSLRRGEHNAPLNAVVEAKDDRSDPALLRAPTDTIVDNKAAPVNRLMFDFGCQTEPDTELQVHATRVQSSESVEELTELGEMVDLGETNDDKTSASTSPRADGTESKRKDKKRGSKTSTQTLRQSGDTKIVRGQSMRDKRSR